MARVACRLNPITSATGAPRRARSGSSRDEPVAEDRRLAPRPALGSAGRGIACRDDPRIGRAPSQVPRDARGGRMQGGLSVRTANYELCE